MPLGNNWDDPWVKTKNDTSKKSMTQEERIEMIKRVYPLVLGREATTRDINYYKYTNYSEDELIKKLLEAKEHKDLLDKGRRFDKLNSQYQSLEMNIKLLKMQSRDQVEIFDHLKELLREKNREIETLRQKLNDPYGFGLCKTSPMVSTSSQSEQSAEDPTETTNEKNDAVKKDDLTNAKPVSFPQAKVEKPSDSEQQQTVVDPQVTIESSPSVDIVVSEEESSDDNSQVEPIEIHDITDTDKAIFNDLSKHENDEKVVDNSQIPNPPQVTAPRIINANAEESSDDKGGDHGGKGFDNLIDNLRKKIS